jgi:hypothetical protein
MHFLIFFYFQTLTWGHIRELYLPSPCSKSIKLCWFQKILWWCGKIFDDMSWNILSCQFEICRVEKIYTKNIPWHGTKYFQRFFFVQVILLICSPTNLVGIVYTFGFDKRSCLAHQFGNEGQKIFIRISYDSHNIYVFG